MDTRNHPQRDQSSVSKRWKAENKTEALSVSLQQNSKSRCLWATYIFPIADLEEFASPKEEKVEDGPQCFEAFSGFWTNINKVLTQ